MAKEIDRVRAQSALAVIKQHPGMVLFVASPAIIALGLVWWFVSPALAVLLLIGAWSAAGPSCSRSASSSAANTVCSLAVKAVPTAL